MTRRTVRRHSAAAFVVLTAATLVCPLGGVRAGPPDSQLAASERPGEREHRLREKQAAPHKSPVEPEKASPSNAFSIECEWIGKRVVNLLLRDDAMAANDFMPFYEGFSCDREHLSQAFGCAVVNDSVTDGEARIQRVNACWRDPSIRLPLAEKNAPSGAKPATDKPAEPVPSKPAPPPSTYAPGGAQKGG